MFISSTDEWAIFTFGMCDLGDPRRTKRLIKISEKMASNIGQSIVKSCGNSAEIEGAYRLIRNDNISPEAIAEGGFRATSELAKNKRLLLALEDTTDLAYSHELVKELGHIGNSVTNKTKGMLVHSVLMVDPKEGTTLGLIEQSRWIRDAETFGCRKDRTRRDFEDKESYKWVVASNRVNERLQEASKNTISVCDREADIIEYLQHKVDQGQRYLVRATFNRPLDNGEHLYDYVRSLTPCGTYDVQIPQRGGRKGRIAKMNISYSKVNILAPIRKQKTFGPIACTVVLCQEANNPDLQWVLVTSENVTCLEEAIDIVQYYETRWKIEEYHKAWKSGGTQVEKLRMQTAGNVERMAVILGFVAVRLLQLREVGRKQGTDKRKCSELLTNVQWRLLWAKSEGKKPKKNFTPTISWAYEKIARLGGWNNSKNNDIVGWNALWEGWFKLDMLVEGYEMRLSLDL